MKMFLRVVITEGLKLKRTLALWMVLVAPMVVVLLQSLIGYFGADQLARGGHDVWPQFANNSVGIWTLLMMPLFITLETSLLAGLEHTDKNWKTLLALPAPRWSIYLAKLTVTIAMVWGAIAILAGGMITAGMLLRQIQPVLKLGDMPMGLLLRPLLRVAVSALFGVAIQHWVSLRWQSFTAAIGFGMCAMVTGFIAVNLVKWGSRFPWSMPIHAIRPAATGEPNLLLAALAGALIVAAIGSWEFSRREIA